MSTRVTIPPRMDEAPGGGRSGLPPRTAIPSTLDNQSRYLYGGAKHSTVHWLMVTSTSGQTYTTATSYIPIMIPLRIPPFTKWLGWQVLTRGSGRVHARVTGTSVYEIRVEDDPRHAPSERIRRAVWSEFVTGAQPAAANVPGALDARASVPDEERGWRSITVEVYVTGDAHLYAILLEPLRLELSGDGVYI